MTDFQIRCYKQIEAIQAYGKLLGICDEYACKRWEVYGYARIWAKKYKGE